MIVSSCSQPEALGKELRDCCLCRTRLTTEQHHSVRAEFKDNLSARPARGTGVVTLSGNGNGLDLHVASFGRNGSTDGCALGANGHAIGRVFHVASLIQSATVGKHRRSYTKIR